MQLPWRQKEEIPHYMLPKSKLTRQERRTYLRIIKQAIDQRNNRWSAQNTIPYERMFKDGICKVKQGFYSKMIEFDDQNYTLLRDGEQKMIYDRWYAFLNTFESGVEYEFSYMNLKETNEAYLKMFVRRKMNDRYQVFRDDIDRIIDQALREANHGLKKRKLLTFGVEADDIRQAKNKLEQIEENLLAGLDKCGSKGRKIAGYERLKIMHHLMNVHDDRQFLFDFDKQAETGLSTKDFIAPDSFEFDRRHFTMGSTYSAISFVEIPPGKLNDSILNDLVNSQSSQVVSFHVHPYNIDKAKSLAASYTREVGDQKSTLQIKSTQQGYDMDILPHELLGYEDDSHRLEDLLNGGGENLFLVSLTVLNTGRTLEELEKNYSRTRSAARSNGCNLVRISHQQEGGFKSILPLAYNEIEISRQLTTSSLAIFIPFSAKNLFMKGNEVVYYGRSAITGMPIIFDRKSLPAPNGLILGATGMGKSFAAKREIIQAFLRSGDDIMILDPEQEYVKLAERLDGQVIQISASSNQYINPMDIDIDYNDDNGPIAKKADFILSLIELMYNGRGTLTPEMVSSVDECLNLIYQDYLKDPQPEKMPTLETLYTMLASKEDDEAAQKIAKVMKVYVDGSLNLFNHRTNVDYHNRLVVFDIKDIGSNIKKIAMMIVQDQIWKRVTENRSKNKRTWYFLDEIHLLLKDEQTAAYTIDIWKRFRKWGGIPTGITQNINDLVGGKDVDVIFENSSFIYMLSPGDGEKEIISKLLNITPRQMDYLNKAGKGEGILYCENEPYPFYDKFPEDSLLFNVMDTRPASAQVAYAY